MLPRNIRQPQVVKRIERQGSAAGRAAHRNVLARRMLGETKRFAANSKICGEGKPVEYVYEVVTGAVRTVKLLADKRRQIVGFYFAGDIFALSQGNENSLSVEAVVRTSVRVIKLKTLVRLAANDLKLAEELLTMTMREVSRARRHAVSLAMTAHERVNEFLAEMMERISVGDHVQLPMSRHDIADYLGLSTETVSRAMTSLKDASKIRVPSRRSIVVRDRAVLGGEVGAAWIV